MSILIIDFLDSILTIVEYTKPVFSAKALCEIAFSLRINANILPNSCASLYDMNVGRSQLQEYAVVL